MCVVYDTTISKKLSFIQILQAWLKKNAYEYKAPFVFAEKIVLRGTNTEQRQGNQNLRWFGASSFSQYT